MAFLQRVTRGAPVKRDWIAENTVREAVGGAHGLRECPFPARAWQAWIVSGYDTSGAAKKKGQPVMIDAAQALADDDVLPFATPTANLSSGFGVLTDDMEASGFGDAVIAGAVWTTLTGSGAAAGDFVIPAASGANWWTKSGSGAKVLWLSANGVALILLGGAGGGGGEYNGYFKAVLVTETENDQEVKKVKIINGEAPNDTVCGHTDIGNVDAATLNFEEGKSLYLTAAYSSTNNRWSFSFVMAYATAVPTGMYWEIAACMERALRTAKTVGEKARQTIPIPWQGIAKQVADRYAALIDRKKHEKR